MCVTSSQLYINHLKTSAVVCNESELSFQKLSIELEGFDDTLSSFFSEIIDLLEVSHGSR